MKSNAFNQVIEIPNFLSSPNTNTQVLTTNESVHLYNRVNGALPRLRRVIKGKMDSETKQWVLATLDEFADFVNLDKENTRSEPHIVNQNLMLNFGILNDIFDILSIPIDPVNDPDDANDIIEIYKRCFLFARELTHKHKDIQARFFARLDMILDVPGCEQEKAFHLEQVFVYNMDTCTK